MEKATSQARAELDMTEYPFVRTQDAPIDFLKGAQGEIIVSEARRVDKLGRLRR